MAADSGAMSAPQLIPETGKSTAPTGSAAGGPKEQRKGRTITMKFLFWSMYILSAFFALIYCILCFFTYQEFMKLERRMRDGPEVASSMSMANNDTATTLNNVTQGGAVMVSSQEAFSYFAWIRTKLDS